MRISIISKLPADLRLELENLIRANCYGNTYALAAWLTERGYPISHAAIGAYSRRMKLLECPDHGLSPEKVRAAINLGAALQQFISAFITAPATPEPTDRTEKE